MTIMKKATSYFLPIFGLLCCVVFHSCSNESISASEGQEENLYPLEIGKYWIYEVDSVLYSLDGMSVDTSNSFIREEMTEILVNDFQDSSYVITRSFGTTETGPWAVTDIWTASIDNGLLTKTEENLKFLKLSYPLTLNKTWNGNQFFDENIEVNLGAETLMPYRNWESKVLEIDATTTVGDMTFDQVTRVELVSDSSFIELRYGQEWYAEDIGMIKKELKILDTQCTSCDGQTWEEKAHKGLILNMNLIEHN